jgi:hypothetical protein
MVRFGESLVFIELFITVLKIMIVISIKIGIFA